MGLGIKTEIVANLRGLKQFRRAMGGNGDEPEVRKAIVQWGARYRGAMQQRFVRFSRGGGDWPPLKHERRHKRDRRAAAKKKKKGQKPKGAAILRDTNTLFGVLDPVFTSKPGQFQDNISWGIVVGFGGPAKHPEGPATVADIAGFHHRGAGNLPVRKILVNPEQNVVRAMAEDMRRALTALGKRMVEE